MGSLGLGFDLKILKNLGLPFFLYLHVFNIMLLIGNSYISKPKYVINDINIKTSQNLFLSYIITSIFTTKG